MTKHLAGRLFGLILIVGLGLLAVGVAMVGNAYFAQESLSVNMIGLSASGPASPHLLCLFLKPGDRMILALSSSENLSYQVSVRSVAGNETLMDVASAGQALIPFSPESRGLFLVSVEVDPNGAPVNSSAMANVSVIGATPKDLLPLGTGLAALGTLFTLSSWAAGRYLPPAREKSPKAGGHSGFLSLVSWEFVQGRKGLISLLVFLVLAYSSFGFNPDIRVLGTSLSLGQSITQLLHPTVMPIKDWTNIYPIVAAAAAFTFAYEKDRLVLRSTLLNPIRSSTVFLAKAVSLLLTVLIPVVASTLITLALYDPGVLLKYPSYVFGNAWIWISLYALLFSIMLGFCLLPATYFRKPVYAFIVPVLAYFLVETEGFGVGNLLPSVVFQTVGTGPLSNLIGEVRFDWLPLLDDAFPSMVLASALAVLAYLCFQYSEKE
ncbi:MAG: hypothetical protein ABSG92_10580 [Conexivisphaerales archaeon]